MFKENRDARVHGMIRIKEDSTLSRCDGKTSLFTNPFLKGKEDLDRSNPFPGAGCPTEILKFLTLTNSSMVWFPHENPLAEINYFVNRKALNDIY